MSTDRLDDDGLPRRDFLKQSALAIGAVGAMASDGRSADSAAPQPASSARPGQEVIMRDPQCKSPTRRYQGEQLNRIAFPMGGIGAGMVCLEGTGALSHLSIYHKPDVYNEPTAFAAVCIKQPGGNLARVLEGQVPAWKLFGPFGSGNGASGKTYGLPRFTQAEFEARFPFALIRLTDAELPLDVQITGWSPFEPGDADNSSLPVAALEYRLTNRTTHPVEAVFSFNARHVLAPEKEITGCTIGRAPGGFVFHKQGAADKPWDTGDFCVRIPGPGVKVNHAWFRGGWFDAMTMAWNDVQNGVCEERPPAENDNPSPGASVFVPFSLSPGESRIIPVQLSWHVGVSGIRFGEAVDAVAKDEDYTSKPSHQAWYAARFAGVDKVSEYWHSKYDELRAASLRFCECFYDTTLPAEVIDAVAANLTILKSPTVMRQADGRLWAWEGCKDARGCCYGSCTHVWNYAQAIPHLFPSLERSLRETEFFVAQNDQGHQAFRTPLPIRQPLHDFHSAADGQLGGIMKIHRDWRISGSTEWLRRLWPAVRKSLDYAIATWDPRHTGLLEEPHHNTYDIEFWGPDGMCTSFYLGALQAAVNMGKALKENVSLYEELLAKGTARAERELFDGEYFFQKIQWEGLSAGNPLDVKSFGGKYSPEAIALLQKEGPKYQYGKGCLSDGVLGSWMAAVCGVGQVLDRERVASHLRSIHKYNLRKDLRRHANPQRPSYACGHEGGLLLCTWPKGGALSIPFIYSNEVWTGIEYSVASHLMIMGLIDEALDIVRTCRARYDGRIRNPFNEYECGHWYARAMSSYAMLFGLTGLRYDAVDGTLHVNPRITGDFRCFIATNTGYGTAGMKDGKPFIEVKKGEINVARIDAAPPELG